MKKIWKIQVKFLFVVVIPRLTGIIPAKLVSVSWCFLFRVNLVQKLDLCGWITKVYKRSIFVTQIGVPTTFSNTTLFLNRLQVGYVLSFGMRPHPSNSGHQEYYICYCYRVGATPRLTAQVKSEKQLEAEQAKLAKQVSDYGRMASWVGGITQGGGLGISPWSIICCDLCKVSLYQ